MNTESGPCRVKEGKSVILGVDYNISKPFYYLRIGSCTAYIYCQVIDARGKHRELKMHDTYAVWRTILAFERPSGLLERR